jgi:hypothetical protein
MQDQGEAFEITTALDRLRLLIVQPVLRAWGKLSWDLSETTPDSGIARSLTMI